MAQTSLGIFTTDPKLVIRSWDEWLAQTTGIPASAASGKHLTDVVPDLESRGLLDPFRRSLEEGVIEILSSRFHHYLIPCPPLYPSRRFDRMQQKVTIAPLKEESATIGLIVTVEDVTPGDDRTQDDALIETFDHDSWNLRRSAADTLAQHGSEHAIANLLRALREQHRNASVLNSALRVLTGSGMDTLSPLVELLDDPDHELRMYAALALGDLKNRGAIPALIPLLKDPDANVRYHAIEALTKIKAPEAAKELLEIAQSGDFFLAFPAIDALARLDDPQIAVRLVPLLQDEMVRTAVVDALGNLGDEHVIAPMVALLNQPGPHVTPIAEAVAVLHDRYEKQFGEGAHIIDLVRQHAPAGAAETVMDTLDESESRRLRGLVRLLGWIDDGRAAGSLTRLLGSEEVRKEVIEALVRHGKGVTAALIGQLRNDDTEVRRAAIVALGRIGDPECVPELAWVLTENPELAVPAATALARIGDSRAYESLVNLLGHANAAVRQAVIAAVNSLGDSRMEADVVRLIEDPNPHVRESAVRIAGYFGYATCARQIIWCVHDPDENVRRAAIESLPYLEDPDVLSVLLRELSQESPRIRAAAAQALGYLEEPAALRALIGALGDTDSWVRYYAARSLGRLAAMDALDRLASMVKSDPATPVRIAAAHALAAIGGSRAAGVLSSLLESDERDLSSAAASALGSIGHPDALPPLLAMMRSIDRSRRLDAIRAVGARSEEEVIQALEWVAATDRDVEVAAAAINELASIASPPALGSLVRLTAQTSLREACVSALAQVDNEQMPTVAEGFKHPQKEVRRAVIEALSRKKHPTASGLIANALEDAEPSVRLAAVMALSRLGSRNADRKLSMMMSGDPDLAVRTAAQKALER